VSKSPSLGSGRLKENTTLTLTLSLREREPIGGSASAGIHNVPPLCSLFPFFVINRGRRAGDEGGFGFRLLISAQK